jgi:hypothetical protein
LAGSGRVDLYVLLAFASDVKISHQMQTTEGDRMGGEVPGAAGLHLLDGVPLLRPDEQVFEAMLTGWRNQQLARWLFPGRRAGQPLNIRQMGTRDEESRHRRRDQPAGLANDLQPYAFATCPGRILVGTATGTCTPHRRS